MDEHNGENEINEGRDSSGYDDVEDEDYVPVADNDVEMTAEANDPLTELETDAIYHNGGAPSDYNAEEGPLTGMTFRSLEILMRAYQDHAKLKGFCVSKRTGRKSSDGEKKYVQIVCDRGRKPQEEKNTKRTGCPAKLNCIKRGEGVWQVSKVSNTHNHELQPDMSHMMPAHRNLTVNMKRQLEANDIAGIRPCKNIRLLQVQAGGPSNLGCSAKDCRNFIEQRRRQRLGEGDADAIRKLFARMKEKDRNFISVIDVNEEGRLVNVLWIHPRSRAAYEEFHDVVSFDTTYLVNRYQMPFATIIGVNHHGQSMLLGCALISKKDTESFKWLFELAGSHGKHPSSCNVNRSV